MKTCSKCGEAKPTTEFSKCASSRDGLQYFCKTCHGKAVRKSQIKNPLAKSMSRAKHMEKELERNRAYKAANKESVRIHSQNRRARKRASGGELSKGLADRLRAMQRGKCACGCKQPLGTDYHLDHIMPIALGGTNTDDNMQLLTATCNLKKGAKHPVEFMQQRGFLL